MYHANELDFDYLLTNFVEPPTPEVRRNPIKAKFALNSAGPRPRQTWPPGRCADGRVRLAWAYRPGASTSSFPPPLLPPVATIIGGRPYAGPPSFAQPAGSGPGTRPHRLRNNTTTPSTSPLLRRLRLLAASSYPPNTLLQHGSRTGATRTSKNPLQAKFGESSFHALG